MSVRVETVPAALILLLLFGWAFAQEGGELGPGAIEGASPLLARGELLLIESEPDGAPRAATAFSKVDAPVEIVWETILDYANYRRFVPRAIECEVVARSETRRDVRFEAEAPGPNLRYTIRFDLDASRRTIDGTWLRGDLKGGRWSWRLHRDGERTVVSYTTRTGTLGSVNGLLRQLDDAEHSLAFGLDMSSAFQMTRAVGREAFRRAAVRRKPRRAY